MNKILFKILIIAITAIFSFKCASADKINEYVFDVGQFTDLKIQDNVNVVYKCVPDSTAKVAFSGESEFADAFIFSNSGKTLKIQVNTEDVDKPGLPTLYVYSDFLNKVENYSDFSLKVINPAPCPDFSASIIGNGSITISNLKATDINAKIIAGNGRISINGSCSKATFRIAGTGIIQADELKAATVICKIVGGGTIGCHPTDLLSVSGVGSTKIYYKGNPTIKHRLGGKLFKID